MSINVGYVTSSSDEEEEKEEMKEEQKTLTKESYKQDFPTLQSTIPVNERGSWQLAG